MDKVVNGQRAVSVGGGNPYWCKTMDKVVNGQMALSVGGVNMVSNYRQGGQRPKGNQCGRE